MSLMRRFTSIFRAKANRALDAAEDPRETLDYSYERQLDMLQQMRRAVTDVATSRKRIELQADQLQKTAAKLHDQAERAVQQNREDLAREALARRASLNTQLQDLKEQHDQLATQEQKLAAAARRLEAKIQAFRTRKETMKATYSAAQAETKVNEALGGISEEMGDVGIAMQRAEDKVAQLQARSAALDHLLESGALEDLSSTGDPIQAELDRTAGEAYVDVELERMKRELGAGGAAGELEKERGAAATGTARDGHEVER